jgi:CRP/FNR family transcriptional regulator, dissimilatory nitrate respiration regulator
VLRKKADVSLRLALQAHATETREYRPGECVFRERDESCGMYFVNSGMVRLFVESDECTPILEQIATEGCVLGLPATMSGEPYSLTAVAAEHTILLHLGRESLDQLIRSDTAFAMQLLALLSAEVTSLRLHVANSKTNSSH